MESNAAVKEKSGSKMPRCKGPQSWILNYPVPKLHIIMVNNITQMKKSREISSKVPDPSFQAAIKNKIKNTQL